MEPETTNGASERPRSSVRYPYFSLARSLEFASEIRKIGGTEAAEDDVLSSLGLSSKTTRRWTYGLSSAEEFGLVTRTGRGKEARLRVTELAKQLLLPSGPDEERLARAAALLKPPVYQALIRRFSGAPLPTLDGLANILVRDFGLLESVAEPAAEGFLESIEFVGFVKGGIVAGDATKPPPPTQSIQAEKPLIDDAGGMQTLSVPATYLLHQFLLRRDLRVVVPLPPDLSHRDVQRLTKWLTTLPLDAAEDES